jgi:methyltransferase (TIGR00027 family)
MPSDKSDQKLLASTACWTAAVRAHESERADHLFHDPWAALLAGQADQIWLDRVPPGISKASDVGMVIRTKFFDDFLLRATTEHQIRQVVIVAAGMDTRSFRLIWPEGTRLFELDQPELLAQKEQLLSSAGASPTCWRQAIGADLRGPWADTLCQTCFDPLQSSVWLLEGFLQYLPNAHVSHLLDEITTLSAAESWLGFDTVNHDMMTSTWTRSWVEFLEQSGVPWLSTMDEPEAVLAELGWAATVTQFGEESANFGRWSYPVLPRSVPGVPRSLLVTATRRLS